MNVIVNNSEWTNRDIKVLFDGEDIHFTDCVLMPNLLVELGIYKSTSQARQAGRTGEIPLGWTGPFKASKKKTIWIWNPTE